MPRFVVIGSESAGADTLSRIQRGSYEFPDEPMVSTEAKDFVGKVRVILRQRGTWPSLDIYILSS